MQEWSQQPTLSVPLFCWAVQ